MIGAVRLDGTTACMAVDGATNTEVFRAFASEILKPTLRPNDIVIMDNLSAHKSEPTIELIQEAGAQVLFLPPYSPDLNPIEKMWSKIKKLTPIIRSQRPTQSNQGYRKGTEPSDHTRRYRLVCFMRL